MRRLLGTLVSFLILLSAPALAQKKCVKGIPCGNTCIAANKTCRVGTPSSTPTTTQTQQQRPSTSVPSVEEAPWVASSRGQVYYRRGCSGGNKLSPANLIYFKTEEQAQKAGYRRSTSRGC